MALERNVGERLERNKAIKCVNLWKSRGESKKYIGGVEV
jgi:hypothetical protein